MAKIDPYLWGGFIVLALLFMLMALASIGHFKQPKQPEWRPDIPCQCTPLIGTLPAVKRFRITRT